MSCFSLLLWMISDDPVLSSVLTCRKTLSALHINSRTKFYWKDMSTPKKQLPLNWISSPSLGKEMRLISGLAYLIDDRNDKGSEQREDELIQLLYSSLALLS